MHNVRFFKLCFNQLFFYPVEVSPYISRYRELAGCDPDFAIFRMRCPGLGICFHQAAVNGQAYQYYKKTKTRLCMVRFSYGLAGTAWSNSDLENCTRM